MSGGAAEKKNCVPKNPEPILEPDEIKPNPKPILTKPGKLEENLMIFT